MNTILKRKLSSVLHPETIVNNLKQLKHRKINKQKPSVSIINELVANSNSNKRKKNDVSSSNSSSLLDSIKPKRQKKTHYNENMEPITLREVAPSSNEPMPKRIREVVWNTYNGENYTSKCYVTWCNNKINVFNYQVGHDLPDSKGGTFHIHNLRPICSNCNLSMGNKYTIQEWNQLIQPLAVTSSLSGNNNTLDNINVTTTHKSPVSSIEPSNEPSIEPSNESENSNILNQEQYRFISITNLTVSTVLLLSLII
jgi:hypothetical protein